MTQQERRGGPLFLCKRIITRKRTRNLLSKNYNTDSKLEVQKKFDTRTLILFAYPSSFFRKERNKESPGKAQWIKTNLNTGQKWGNR